MAFEPYMPEEGSDPAKDPVWRCSDCGSLHPARRRSCWVCDPIGQEVNPSEGQQRAAHPHARFEDPPEDRIKDSGERRSFGTGAVRDGSAETKGAPHLRPVHALNLLDRHMQAGARKYQARNWEKGIPLSVFFDSAQRHADKYLAGYDDEDHLAAWLWNVACLAETRHRIQAGLLPEELNDLPTLFSGIDTSF